MLKVILMLASVVQSGWNLSDTTNNITGERTVLATAISTTKIENQYAAISLYCVGNEPALSLRWPSRLGNDYALISIKRFAPRSVYDVLPPTPWRILGHGDGAIAEFSGPMIAKLAAEAADAVNFSVSVHGSQSVEQVDFDPAGFGRAYKSLAESCLE